MEFVPPPPVLRVLCADCGKFSSSGYYSMLDSDSCTMQVHRSYPIPQISALHACEIREFCRLINTGLLTVLIYRRVDITEGIPKQGAVGIQYVPIAHV